MKWSAAGLGVGLALALGCMGAPVEAPPQPSPEPVAPPEPTFEVLEKYGSAEGRYFAFSAGAELRFGVDGAKVRAGPSAEAEIVHEGGLAEVVVVEEMVGPVVELIGRNHRWVRVRGPEGAFEGFVFGSLLTPVAGTAFSEESGEEVPWAVTYNPDHKPRLRVLTGEEEHVLDLELTTFFEGGHIMGEAGGYGDFELGFSVSQCALVPSAEHPACVSGSARFIDDKLTQDTVVDRWRFDVEAVDYAPEACESASVLKLADAPEERVRTVAMPSYMRGPSGDVSCLSTARVETGKWAGKRVVDCSIEGGGKSAPIYWMSERFVVDGTTWHRLRCSSDNEDPEVSSRLGDAGIRVVDTVDRKLGGAWGKPARLSAEFGTVKLYRHETGTLKTDGEPLFIDDEVGPVYLDGQGDLGVPTVPGYLRYGWAPRELKIEGSAGEWEAGVIGCGGENERGNLLLEGFEPAPELAVGTADGQPVYRIPPSDPNHAVLTERAEPAVDMNPGAKEAIATPDAFLAVRDPWGRWVGLVRRELRMPNMCEPIVYLYADPPLPVHVGFADSLKLWRTWPPARDGWDATATADGRPLVDGVRWDHLFWDGHSGRFPRSDRGWTLPRADWKRALASHLESLGLVGREVDEALTAWKVPGDSAFVRVTVHDRQTVERLAPLRIEPRPDTSIRVFVELEPTEVWEALDPPPKFTGVREGFTFVEWGSVER